MPKVLSPQDWRALVDYDLWTDPFTPDDGVALHHGGGFDYRAGRAPFNEAAEIQQLQQWEGYHIYHKGWRGLAYGFGVGQTGNIYRIRGFNTYGAHTGDVDGDGIANNKEIVPIIFIGSGHHHELSPAAQDSIAWLRQEVIEKTSPKAVKLWGHQELKGTVTSCPGPNGMAYVKENRLLLGDDMALTDQEKKDIAQEVWFFLITDPTTGTKRGAAHHVAQAYRYAHQAATIGPGADPAAIAQAIVDAGLADAVADKLRTLSFKAS